MSRSSIVFALTLALACVGWLNLVRVALRFCNLPPAPVSLVTLGWPAPRGEIAKLITLPDGVTAYVVLAHENRAIVCRVDLTTGRASGCTELPYVARRGVLHVYAAGQLVIESNGAILRFDADGVPRRIELPKAAEWSLAQLTWSEKDQRFVVVRERWVGDGLSWQYVRLPVDPRGVRIDPGDVEDDVAAGSHLSALTAVFPSGSVVYRRSGEYCVPTRHGEPRCAAKMYVSSGQQGELRDLQPGARWADARGIGSERKTQGMSLPATGRCELAIAVRDDASEEPQISCIGPDGVHEARLGDELARFRTRSSGGVSIIEAERVDGKRFLIARKASDAERIRVVASHRAVLLLSEGAVPLGTDLEPSSVPPLSTRVAEILRERWRVAAGETAGHLLALLLFPAFAWLAVRAWRSRRGSGWTLISVVLLQLHAAITFVAQFGFPERFVPP